MLSSFRGDNENNLQNLQDELENTKRNLKEAKLRIAELEKDKVSGVVDRLDNPYLVNTLTFAEAMTDGLAGTTLDDSKAVVLVGGHHVYPRDRIALHRFNTAQEDVRIVQRRSLRVEVFVSLQPSSARKPFFTAYWDPSQTIADLRKELRKVLDYAECNAWPESEVVFADALGRMLGDDEKISCTITKSGESSDYGWVICQLLKKNLFENEEKGGEQTALGPDRNLGDALLKACKTLPCCNSQAQKNGDIGERSEEETQRVLRRGDSDEGCTFREEGDGEEHDLVDYDSPEDSVSTVDDDGEQNCIDPGRVPVLFDAGTDAGAFAKSSSAKELFELHSIVDAEFQGTDIPADERPDFEGPGGTKMPNFKCFTSLLPESVLQIPDRVATQNAIRSLRDKFIDMGLHPSSGSIQWRNLPVLFENELGQISKDMDPLNTSSLHDVAACFSAFCDGVSALTAKVPHELHDYKDKLEKLNSSLEIYRRAMLRLDNGQAAEVLEYVSEELKGFDETFDQLAEQFEAASEWMKIPEEVERDQMKFEQMIEEMQKLKVAANEQLEREVAMRKLTKSTQDAAVKFRAQAENQIIWSLELNLLAQQAAKNDRKRLDDEIRQLKERRKATNKLFKRHRKRREQIVDLARASRKSYLHFCQQERQISEAVATRVTRAENQVRMLERGSEGLVRLAEEYANSLRSARVTSRVQLLGTGLDAFTAYCGSRKFHYIDHSTARDAYERQFEKMVRSEVNFEFSQNYAMKERSAEARSDLELAKKKFEEDTTRTKVKEDQVIHYEEKRTALKQQIDAIEISMRQTADDTVFASAVTTHADLRGFRQELLDLEHPTAWEEEYEQMSREDLATIQRKVQERHAQRPERMLRIA